MHQQDPKAPPWQKLLMGLFPLIAIWGGYLLYATANDGATETDSAQSMNKSSINQPNAAQPGRKYKLISSECNSPTVDCKPLNYAHGDIQFAKAQVIVESMSQLKFLPVNSGEKKIKRLEAELVGENMFMGKIPITFARADEGWQGQFFLGMCSERKMRWRMKVTATLDDDSQEQGYILFDSHWPE